MAVTVPEFRAAFAPTFDRTPEGVISLRLTMAEARTSADVWTDASMRNAGILYLAAHLVAIEPGGREMRKGERAGDTPYARERERLERIVSSGFRVAAYAPVLDPAEDFVALE